MIDCLSCNKRTTNPKFCSRSCAATYSNKRVKKHKSKVRICAKCREIFYWSKSARKTFCPDCTLERSFTILQARQDTTIGDYRNRLSLRGKHPSWLHAHIRGLNRTRNKDMAKNGCRQCGYKTHVELCHIKPVSSFPTTAKISEVNDPSNIVPLCPNHHWELDNGFLAF